MSLAFISNETKRFIAFVLSLAMLLLLGACSAESMRRAEENSRRNQQEFLSRKRAQLEDTCNGYGFKRGTDAYAQCLQKAERDWNDDFDKSNKEQRDRWRRTQCYSSGRLDC